MEFFAPVGFRTIQAFLPGFFAKALLEPEDRAALCRVQFCPIQAQQQIRHDRQIMRPRERLLRAIKIILEHQEVQ